MTRSTAGGGAGLVAVAASAWLLHRDGSWNTLRMPLFWPFLFTVGTVTVFSTSDIADDAREWRQLVRGLGLASAAVVAAATWLAGTNPINGIHGIDIAAMSAMAALATIAGGAAVTAASRFNPSAWARAAWCLAASAFALWLIPPVLGFVHARLGS